MARRWREGKFAYKQHHPVSSKPYAYAKRRAYSISTSRSTRSNGGHLRQDSLGDLHPICKPVGDGIYTTEEAVQLGEAAALGGDVDDRYSDHFLV